MFAKHVGKPVTASGMLDRAHAPWQTARSIAPATIVRSRARHGRTQSSASVSATALRQAFHSLYTGNIKECCVGTILNRFVMKKASHTA